MKIYLVIFERSAVRKLSGMPMVWTRVWTNDDAEIIAQTIETCRDSAFPIKVLVDVTNSIRPAEVVLTPDECKQLGDLLWRG